MVFCVLCIYQDNMACLVFNHIFNIFAAVVAEIPQLNMNKKIKNIIFDYGGILTGFEREGCIKAFNDLKAYDVAQYVVDKRQEDFFYDLEMGNISVHEFCNEARRIGRTDASDEDLCRAWETLLAGVPSEKVRMLERLSEKYNLYMLSNTNSIHWDYSMAKIFPEAGINTDVLFKKVFLSYKMHLMKPSEDIFRKVVEDAAINADESIFIDDSEQNCIAAQNTGLNVIHAPKGYEWMDIVKDLL